MESSVAPGMDGLECEPSCSTSVHGVEYPCSQELFSDSGSILESENISTATENSSNEDEDSLFQAPRRHVPSRAKRSRRCKDQPLGSLSTCHDSSDSDCVPMTHKISEYLKNPFRKWNKSKVKGARKSRSLAKGKSLPRHGKSKSLNSMSLEEKRRRLLDPGIRFPFTPFKYLPFKQYFTYEQFALGGFLNHVKNLKYEHTLKKSLKDMKIDEDLEIENSVMRKYSYLDDDGSLSPISEPEENLNEDKVEDEEIKVVENSTFILDCQVPSKKNWQITNK